MPRPSILSLALLLCSAALAHAQLPPVNTAPAAQPATAWVEPAPADLTKPPAKDKDKNGNGDKEDKADKPDKPPRTLFEWAIGKEEKKGNGDEEDEDEADDIVTDRPDFTEASSTVGRGRIQLETGYTFASDRDQGGRKRGHSYPEMLWRIGMFADWFELRIFQNFASETVTDANGRVTDSGAEDLILGCKLWLLEQKKCLPEVAMILQVSVPTGAAAFTAEEVLPGGSLLYGWDVLPDCLTIAGSTVFSWTNSQHTLLDGAPGLLGPLNAQHSYFELAQSGTVGYTITDKLGAYTEFFAFFPSSSIDPEVGPEYYFNGGFTYKVTPNLQFDIRSGVGLNEHADDFFAGLGVSIRR